MNSNDNRRRFTLGPGPKGSLALRTRCRNEKCGATFTSPYITEIDAWRDAHVCATPTEGEARR